MKLCTQRQQQQQPVEITATFCTRIIVGIEQIKCKMICRETDTNRQANDAPRKEKALNCNRSHPNYFVIFHHIII